MAKCHSPAEIMRFAHDGRMPPDHAWFTALADHENATDAAAALGIGQPTLSRRLAALEHELGVRLFDRPGRRLVLNEAGRLYADAARRADLTMTVARTRIAELHGARAELRLGFLHSFGPWLVPQLLRAVGAQLPRAGFHLVQDAAETVCRLVRDGDLDIAVVSPRPRSEPALAWRLLLSQPVALAVPGGHPLAQQDEVSLAQARKEIFVTMPSHFGMRRVLDEACADAGFTPRIGTCCQELGTVRGLVAAGLGVALLPVEPGSARASDPEGHAGDGVTLVSLRRPRVEREVGLVWARDRALPEPARLVRDATLPRPGR